MFDPERVDMRLGISSAASSSGARDFDFHIGTDFWLLTELVRDQPTHSAMVRTMDTFNYVDDVIKQRNKKYNMQLPAQIYTPEQLKFPGYYKHRDIHLYVVESEELKYPKRPASGLKILPVNECTPNDQAMFLEDVQQLMISAFDFSEEYAVGTINERLFRDPNILIYVGLNSQDLTACSAILINDGLYTSAWGVNTYRPDRGQGYAQSLLAVALKDSETVFGRPAPAYLLTTHNRPTVYTDIGFQKAKTYHNWRKYYRKEE